MSRGWRGYLRNRPEDFNAPRSSNDEIASEITYDFVVSGYHCFAVMRVCTILHDEYFYFFQRCDRDNFVDLSRQLLHLYFFFIIILLSYKETPRV